MHRIVAAVAVSAMVGVVCSAPAAAVVNTKPISQQSCKELAKTDKRIKRELAPSKPLKTVRRAGKDAAKVTRRVNQLGGCLSKKAKAKTTPTGPSGAVGDAGVTPQTQAGYLALVATDTNLQGLAATDLINLGLGLCSDLDKGTSIATEAKTIIKAFKARGLSATDAEQVFWEIASGAADNGTLSFCNRHADKVEAYNNSRA